MKISTILYLLGFLLFALLFRLYKRIGRRCDCGEILKSRHVSKIYLATATFHPAFIVDNASEIFHGLLPTSLTKAGKSIINKWWIRNSQTVTFSICGVCGRKKVVTISNRPISLWHLLWIWFVHREQFMCDTNLDFVLEGHIRDLRNKKNFDPERNVAEPPVKMTL